MKVYAVYSIPKSPEFRLEKLFKTKESAKKYISTEKEEHSHGKNYVYDIQIEEIEE